ncbi:MAG TPA: 30S ribosomal protein S1, partial [Actinobacteria bacterium]|nr:30S ribosomal protein S1 [Actinomycetota bacterium]
MMEDENGRLVPDYDSTIKFFNEGDLITGTVVKIDKNEVLVDVSYKSEGVIPLRELSVKRDVDPREVVSVGDEIETLVLQKEDAEGRLILSKRRAQYEKAWNKITEASKKNETISGRVIEVVKGGLILDIGLRGFLPASLIDYKRVRDLTSYLGCEFECKIIEIDRRRNNVVLSRKAVLGNSRKKERNEILSKLEKGQLVVGKISSIVDFGAFVDMGGIDGLIHISELSWEHVSHPSEIVSMGDEVKVQVLDIDKERERISLGLKQMQKDPWQDKIKDYKEGDFIEGKITRIVPFGAFVELPCGPEGLIHVSEIAKVRVESPEIVVKVGQNVKARILEIDRDKRKICLSLKQSATEDKKDKIAEEEEIKEQVKP